MSVQFPASSWPSALDERGPAEDPTILLTGTATIGGAEVQVVAIRIDPSMRWAPDYRSDVAEGRYRADGLADLIEGAIEDLDSVAVEFGEAMGRSRTDVVTLGGEPYMVWCISGASNA
jgi:hypothetical protein